MEMQWDKITKEYQNVMMKIKAGINAFLGIKNYKSIVIGQYGICAVLEKSPNGEFRKMPTHTW